MGEVTIKDIAIALGMAPSTVSRALRGSYEINEKTRLRVEKYAQQVNYRRNTIAQSLREKRTRVLGVVVPEISNNFFSEVINGIEDEAFTRGYQILIFQTHESFEREKQTVQQLYERRVDGLLISLSGQTTDIEHLSRYRKEDLSVVYFDRVPEGEEVDKVVVDSFEGVYSAVNWMVSNGMRKIALLTSPPDIYITKKRLAGYTQALEDNGITYNEELIKYCGFEPWEAHEAIKELIDNHQPDGFITCADRLTIDSYEEFKRQLTIGSTSLVPFFGFTNINVAHLLDPPINAIVQPAYEMGSKAAKLLIDKLEYNENKHSNRKPSTTPTEAKLKTKLKIHFVE
ncbi:MAG: LacI family transcriptional regulator [Spirosomataceae bacterium]|jgi:LacI family transcriptional regulator